VRRGSSPTLDVWEARRGSSPSLDVWEVRRGSSPSLEGRGAGRRGAKISFKVSTNKYYNKDLRRISI